MYCQSGLNLRLEVPLSWMPLTLSPHQVTHSITHLCIVAWAKAFMGGMKWPFKATCREHNCASSFHGYCALYSQVPIISLKRIVPMHHIPVGIRYTKENFFITVCKEQIHKNTFMCDNMSASIALWIHVHARCSTCTCRHALFCPEPACLSAIF